MKQQSLSDIEYTNRGRKTKREEVDQYKKCVEGSDEKEIERLKGMLISARQVETEIFPSIMNYLKKIQYRRNK